MDTVLLLTLFRIINYSHDMHHFLKLLLSLSNPLPIIAVHHKDQALKVWYKLDIQRAHLPGCSGSNDAKVA